MPLPKLMQQVLGSLDRTRHQLRKEHYIGGIHDKIPRGLLVAAVTLHNITQALKGMKRKPDRQDDRAHRTRQMPAQQVRKPYERTCEKTKILEDEEHRAGRQDAHP